MTINIVKAKIHHSKKIWEWRNDPSTIRMSSTNKRVTWHEHNKWYEKQIVNKASNMYIAKKNNSYLGVVRYEQIPSNKSIYEISINISPEERGKGIGKLVLQKSINCFLKDKSCCSLIKAKVKKENISSIKTFLKCGFELFSENQELKILKLKLEKN